MKVVRKRPTTYQDYRALFHEAESSAGAATMCLMAAKLGLPRGHGLEPATPDDIQRWLRWQWREAYRAYRLDQRLSAYFDAMGSDVCEEILRSMMKDEE